MAAASKQPSRKKRGGSGLRPLFLLLALGGLGQAQLVAPSVTITPGAAPPPRTELARRVLVQPARVEQYLQRGYTTANLSFSLLSEVHTEVALRPRDPRMVFRGPADGRVLLSAYATQSVSFVVLAAHAGTVDILNREGTVIAQATYDVRPPKVLNQSASLSYNPFDGRTSLGYSVSLASTSIFAPSVGASAGLSFNAAQNRLDGNVSLNVRW
ncbi:hypothetical protein [Deinococcus wulumuqiensis]|uniref:hypothetical protein n=1 Tax=Deinococcus wulumuqiensis TaxID=980427 RepID=UPI00242FE2E7|nr:hypothetical protein [Deinococcus wulumuqiensis]